MLEVIDTTVFPRGITGIASDQGVNGIPDRVAGIDCLTAKGNVVDGVIARGCLKLFDTVSGLLSS